MTTEKVIDLSNSAKRLLYYLEKARRASAKLSTASVWETAFGLRNDDPDLIYQRLSLIRYELDQVEKKIAEKGFSSDLYLPYIEQIRSVISSKNIDAPWENYRPKLDEIAFLAIRWCSEIIGQESTADLGGLEKLLEELMKFKTSLEKNKIEGIIYNFVINQINIIEQAIKDYPISGQAAIKKAYKEKYIDIVEKTEDLKDHVLSNNDKNYLNQLKNIWEKFDSATNKITNVYKKIKDVKSIYIENKETVDNAGVFLLSLLDDSKPL